MKVTATKRAIGIHKPGQPFNLPDRTARHLIKAGIIREFTAEDAAKIAAPAPIAAPKPAPAPTVGPDDPAPAPLAVEVTRPKRVYRRRDMTPEGTG